MISCEKCGAATEADKPCKNCKKIYDQKRYKENRVGILEQQKSYDATNKEKKIQYHQKWYKKNKAKLLARHAAYKKEKYASDILFKLRVICSVSIYQAMRSSKNGSSILDYLPYTMKELKQHLEGQFDDKMAWSNYGSYWQIDHIIPQSKLPYSSMEDDNFKKCWALENLRPLEAVANRKKFNKIT